jgi:2-methylisocitrate lyase-like PEP mutase family enzyme
LFLICSFCAFTLAEIGNDLCSMLCEEAAMVSQGTLFRQLHKQPGAFVIPNPWDTGTARILAAMGFSALATTSAGMAFSMGAVDGGVPWETTLRHCQLLVAATPLPVSADLGAGCGDSPQSAAQTVRAAAACGLAGCSLEDYTGRPEDPIYDFSLAVERIAAAAEACAGLAEDFVLTARCENFLWGRPDLDDTLRRLLAFEYAGADVLYAPGLRDLDTIRTVCGALRKPVNVVMGLGGTSFTVQDLAEAGAKRISVGSALARLAYGAFIQAAQEMHRDGTFSFAEHAIGFAEIERFFQLGTTASTDS